MFKIFGEKARKEAGLSCPASFCAGEERLRPFPRRLLVLHQGNGDIEPLRVVVLHDAASIEAFLLCDELAPVQSVNGGGGENITEGEKIFVGLWHSTFLAYNAG